MKKLIVVVAVLLMVSQVTYGEDLWERGYGDKIIKPIYDVNSVGIGTGQPASKLDVRGTITMSGFKLTTGVHSNYVLTCGSGGKGTWQKRIWSKYGSKIYYISNNVGIGTTNPQAKLNVYGGDIQVGYNTGIYTLLNNNDLKFNRDNDPSYICQMGTGKLIFTTNGGSGNPRMTIDNAGDVGVGTTDPQAKLNVYGGDIQVGISSGNYTLLGYNELQFNRDDDPSYICQMGTGKLIFTTNGGADKPRMTIDSVGNVGIGTKFPQSELAVNGKITAKELELVATGWSDFVFADDYKLMPLDRLEQHIKVNKSLPGIPTEKEVLGGGVKVGEMQVKLLEKIEELTLYVIELKKENMELKKRIDALDN